MTFFGVKTDQNNETVGSSRFQQLVMFYQTGYFSTVLYFRSIFTRSWYLDKSILNFQTFFRLILCSMTVLRHLMYSVPFIVSTAKEAGFAWFQ